MSIAKKLHTITENMQKVYDAGAGDGGGNYDEGYQKGYTEGELAGRENQYNDFWDMYQQNGGRINYEGAFSGLGWNADTFKPKYDMQPIAAANMFSSTRITDLKGKLDNLGVALDFSKCISASNIFQKSDITHIGTFDSTSLSNLNQVFYYATALTTVDKLILKSDGSQTFSSSLSFAQCNALTHIIFEGVIGQNNFNIQWSNLDVESLVSILNALADKSTDTSGVVWKITIGAVNKGKLSEEELKIASDKGWSVE